jgi:hypothetical protein
MTTTKKENPLKPPHASFKIKTQEEGLGVGSQVRFQKTKKTLSRNQIGKIRINPPFLET